MPEPIYSLEGKRIWVAGHRGMVGQALLRRLAHENCEIVTMDRHSVDLRRQESTEAFISNICPQVILLAAARVGEILAKPVPDLELSKCHHCVP
jgi:GDP-L-fucose synthase